jgi:hypothetical protein
MATSNPILLKIQQDITEKVTPENKKSFDKTLIAAETVMFSPKSHANLQLVRNKNAKNDLVNSVSSGVTGLMWLLYTQSKHTMKPEVGVMAGIIVVTKSLDFAERGLDAEVTPEIIANTVRKFIESLFLKMGVTPDKLAEAIASGRKEIDEYHTHQTFINGKMAGLKPKPN